MARSSSINRRDGFVSGVRRPLPSRARFPSRRSSFSLPVQLSPESICLLSQIIHGPFTALCHQKSALFLFSLSLAGSRAFSRRACSPRSARCVRGSVKHHHAHVVGQHQDLAGCCVWLRGTDECARKVPARLPGKLFVRQDGPGGGQLCPILRGAVVADVAGCHSSTVCLRLEDLFPAGCCRGPLG